ncbi:39244_t:CDS:2 [Gigaspora margarita]|uniref:39244_t:CDS:1 n=1 Tax=Gigaspora margarita TaxID=4874 RepID=A0ABM8W7A2_GIGMA|nr:39244_t:CDS:2 [Gigaspora margarita]
MLTSIPPEIYQNIFKDLDTDSLYSVILVNRIWCSNAISILWQNPLELLYQNDDSEYFETDVKSVIKTYISCLPKESKLMLSFTDLCIDLLTSSSSIPTFNYPSFLHTLNYVLLSDSVNRIIKDNANVMMVLILLCKLFFDQGFNIRSLEFSTHMVKDYIGSHLKTIYMNLREIPGADTFLSRIQRLCWRDDAPLHCLSSIAEIAKEIRVLDILLESEYENESGSNELFTLINAQINLQQIKIISLKKTTKAISALRSKSNTLRKIFIKGVASFSLDFFYECSNLEELSLLYNESHLLTNPQISRQLRTEIQSYIQAGVLDRTQMVPSVQMVTAIRNSMANIRGTTIQVRSNEKQQLNHSSEMNTSLNPNYLNLSKLTVFQVNLDSFQTTEQVIDIIQCNKGGLRELRIQKTAPISVEHLKKLFLMVINHCPNLIHITLCIPNIAISEIPNLFKKCLLLEEIYLKAVKTMDISETLDEMSLDVPINLKSLSLGLYSWKYSFESIKGFLNGCELRVNKKPIRFLYSDNLIKDVIDVLELYESKGILELVEKRLWCA